jgi:hypothetical protein
MRTLSSSELRALSAEVYDAGSTSGSWRDVLPTLARSLGAAGASVFTINKISRRIDWSFVVGPAAERESYFIDHYVHLDPFLPLILESPGWTTLSERFPASILSRNEWYNDCLLPSGIGDIISTRLVDSPRRSVIFGFYEEPRRRFRERRALTHQLTKPLVLAANRHLADLYGAASTASPHALAEKPRRYFFDLTNGREYRDRKGSVFSSPMDATAHAERIAAKLAADKSWSDFELTIRDEDGLFVLRTPVRI